jgi:hypothetical protein
MVEELDGLYVERELGDALIEEKVNRVTVELERQCLQE